MLPNILFVGDDLFLSYFSLLESSFLHTYPKNCPIILALHQERLNFKLALDKAAKYVIEKNSSSLVFHLGYDEILGNSSLQETQDFIDELFHILESKTEANIFIVNQCISYFQDNDTVFKRTEQINKDLSSLCKMNPSRFTYIDLSRRVSAFLEQHRKSYGLKRALHRLDENHNPILTDFGSWVMAKELSSLLFDLLGPFSEEIDDVLI